MADINKSGEDGLGIAVSDIKREQLADGRMAIAIESKMIPEETIVIPEHPLYPTVRKAFPNGTFPRGCTAVVSVQVFDENGDEITPEDSVFKMPLENYVADETKEVLGVLYFDWTESTKI
jgi:hypothetical protein